MIRLRFIREINKRLNELKRDIRISIVDRDCFDIQPNALRRLSPARYKEFAFERSADKVQAFMAWLEEQERQGILHVSRRPGVHIGIEEAWTDVYIDSAYQRGLRNGRSRLRAAGYQLSLFDEVPGGIQAVMGRRFHADRIGVIYSRTYEDLKSVTQFMNAEIRRRISDGLTTGLARGLAEGKSPLTIARELYKNTADRVDKIGKVRARTIARTEVLNAHHEAQMAEYIQAEQELGEPVMLDVVLGPNPCPICVDLEAGGPYTTTQAMGQLPAHPNCVCAHAPVDAGKTRK